MLKRKSKGFKPKGASSGSSNGSSVAESSAQPKSGGAFRQLLAKFGGGGGGGGRLSASTQNLSLSASLGSSNHLGQTGAAGSSATLPAASPVEDPREEVERRPSGDFLVRRNKAMSLQHLPSDHSFDEPTTLHRQGRSPPTPPAASSPSDSKSLLSFASTSIAAHSPRDVIVECLVGAKRLQATSDLLLLSGERIYAADLSPIQSDRELGRVEDCLDELMSRLRVFPILVGTLRASLADGAEPARLSDPREGVQRFVNAVVVLDELTAAAVFSISSRCPGWTPPRPGVIEQRAVLSAADEVDLSCHRLRHASERMTPNDAAVDEDGEMFAGACERISRCLTFFAVAARAATEATAGGAGEESGMFGLAVRALTANATCLFESVRRFCAAPSDDRRARMLAFANALGAAVHAVVTMVTDEKFAGQPAIAPAQTKATRTKLFGACLNLSSASIQFLHGLADFYATRSAALHRRCEMCAEAITEAVNHFLSIISSLQKSLRPAH